MGVDSDNASLGFGLVCFAGASTGIGAAIVFSKRLVQLANKQFLAGALGVASGVMLYVSFIEIFQKANEAFEDAGHSEDEAYFYATLCFFSGVLFNALLDRFVHFLEARGAELPKHYEANLPGHPDRIEHVHDNEPVQVDMSYVDPRMVQEVVRETVHPEPPEVPTASSSPAHDESPRESPGDANTIEAIELDFPLRRNAAEEETKQDFGFRAMKKAEQSEEAKLKRMGVMTALAIGLHNFPEGLATFVATLDDPSVGISLAIAIAIHNVPEGICVAVPVYYASGSRGKAFLWAALSGLSEILGAALGWAILANTFDDNIFGTLFGVVAGIMVHIVLHELIPTALRYDPDDSIVTHTVFAGAAIMALSLVLFVVF
mmetsp:Transcript_16934/g.64489  ORF Transcript_16934/g.64489 Transcript_16934/m.64489 type:complete len:375 (-) Transcript_16934:162-1286(-)